MRVYQKISFLLAIFVGIFIYYVSSLSSPPSPAPGSNFIPLIYHFGIYFLFGGLLLLASLHIFRGRVLAFFIAVIYAGLDELHQSFVPGRSATIFDFGIDVSGVVMGFVFILVLNKVNFIRKIGLFS